MGYGERILCKLPETPYYQGVQHTDFPLKIAEHIPQSTENREVYRKFIYMHKNGCQMAPVFIWRIATQRISFRNASGRQR